MAAEGPVIARESGLDQMVFQKPLYGQQPLDISRHGQPQNPWSGQVWETAQPSGRKLERRLSGNRRLHGGTDRPGLCGIRVT